jgi:hypothetical protein
LNSEIIALIALWGQDHFTVALRADKGVEPLHGGRAIQRAAEDPEVVRQRRDVVALRVAGRHRLRIEVLRIHEIDVFRTEMISEVDNLPRRSDEVHLGEGIDPLDLRYVMRKAKRPFLRLVQVIR